METKIRKLGNSAAVILSQEAMKAAGLSIGTVVKVDASHEGVSLRKRGATWADIMRIFKKPLPGFADDLQSVIDARTIDTTENLWDK